MTLMASPLVIYGEDNRQDVYASKNTLLKEQSYSTAAMISAGYLSGVKNGIKIEAPLYKDIYKLCSKERFREQVAAASCSGTLIDKDIILTAGHCVGNGRMDCTTYSWVFDYRATSGKQANVIVPSSSVYKCKEIIKAQVDLVKNVDFALIRLDRNVTDRRPIDIRLTGKISDKEKIAAIGHPRGLPTKITDDGDILENALHYMKSNLDTYTVNSGSGVFNERTGELEGVLISGLLDFETDDSAGCTKSKTYKKSEGAEMITKIEAIWPFLDLL